MDLSSWPGRWPAAPTFPSRCSSLVTGSSSQRPCPFMPEADRSGSGRVPGVQGFRWFKVQGSGFEVLTKRETATANMM